MKRFILVCLFTSINMAYAANDSKEAECNFIGLQAEMIMEYRQDGVNMGDVIEKFQYDKELVIFAYDQPRFNTEENKRKSIQDFTNETILKCYKK